LHSIFFDDNIEFDEPHIVDARDLHTGQTYRHLPSPLPRCCLPPLAFPTNSPVCVCGRFVLNISLPLSVTANVFTFKAEPLQAITDPHYYVQALATCERNYELWLKQPHNKPAAASSAASAAVAATTQLSAALAKTSL
jgi:hypothetical protein